MDELPDEIYTRITDLSEEGNSTLDSGNPQAAIEIWKKALSLLPPPQMRWQAAMWLHASIGDAQRESGQLAEALSSFQSAAASDGGAHNAFVQFGLGTSLLDSGRKDEATVPLLRAYMIAGDDIFKGEEPLYLKHLSARKLVDIDNVT